MENTKLNINKAKKNEALIKLDKLKECSARGKIDVAVDWILKTSEQKKLVVFCHHRSILKLLDQKLKNHILISSEMKHIDRQKAVTSFQSDKKIRIFLTTMKISGHGLTLTAADTTVFLQLGWTSSLHDQCEDRCHRIGQESDSVQAIYFIAKHTIEEKIMKLLDTKREAMDAVIDGKKTTQVNLLSELMKEIRNQALIKLDK